jgi:hypothetical protein
MRVTSSVNQERWDWFAAGDPEVAPRIVYSYPHDNSAYQLLFEAGLVFLVPLVLATLIELILGK